MTPKKFLTTLIIFAILIIGLCTYWIVNDLQVSNRARGLDNYLDELLAEKDQEKEQRQTVSDDTVPPTDTSPEKPTDHNQTPNPPDQSTNVTPSEAEETLPITPLTYRYKEGIYKDMTYPEACAAWRDKRDKLLDEFLERSKKSTELSYILLENTDDEIALMLSFLKSMSPEELELTKEATFYLHPNKTEKIEAFFNEVQNKGEILSDEELIEKADSIINAYELNKIARRQNRAEFRRVWAELKEHDKRRPKIPRRVALGY